jgi:hypothetical protein
VEAGSDEPRRALPCLARPFATGDDLRTGTADLPVVDCFAAATPKRSRSLIDSSTKALAQKRINGVYTGVGVNFSGGFCDCIPLINNALLENPT